MIQVYDDIFDAKASCDHLSGFNLQGRYLIVLYHSQTKGMNKKKDLNQKEAEINRMKKKYNVE